jgi:hypothetical protein
MFGKLLKFTEQSNPSEIIETHSEATKAHREAASNVIVLLTSRLEKSSIPICKAKLIVIVI